MKRKRERTIKKVVKKIVKKVKTLLMTLIIIILVALAQKYGILKLLDREIENIGLADKIIDVSNVAIQRVKSGNEIISSVAKNIVIDKYKLNIIFFDVGQADCELIICNGKSMLIDAGNSKDGEKIVGALKSLGIDKLDYVVGTHVHEDHIGGMSYIIDSFEIGAFYLPYNVTSTTTFYKNLLTALTAKNINITKANIGDEFWIGECACEIMSVDNTDPEDINEESIVLELTYRGFKYLFMGDAEESNEKSRTWNDVDVLKVGHHGSITSSSQEFLEQTLPEIAIISVGKGNSYGLPKSKILDRLSNLETQVYRTDKDGTIQLVCDGDRNEIIKVDLSLDGNK